jgi:ribonuclease P protein component
MVETARATFRKRERIVSEKLMEELFSGGNSHALTAFPLRAVYLQKDRNAGDEPVQVLVSVPKKRLRHAVDRNRVKRQVRESYRLNKQALLSMLPCDKRLLLAFVWQSDRLSPTEEVESRVNNLLRRMAERL